MRKIQEEIRQFVESKGGKYRLTTPAIINGYECELTELEVRMLQLKCKKAPDFKKFCENHKIFSIAENGEKYLMEFMPNGCFSNEFYIGFYDVASKISFEIL